MDNGADTGKNSEGILSPFRITLIYLLMGTAWILLSDRLLDLFIADQGNISQFQTYKGLFYILATGAVLFWLIHWFAQSIRRTAKARREAERTLSTLLGNLPGMAYRCRYDKDWTMEIVSGGSLELTGYPPDDLIANRKVAYGQLIVPEDRELVTNGVEAALKEKRSFQMVYRIRTASGEEKWVLELGCGVFSPAGNLLALEGFISDINELKRMEAALRESEERYRLLVETMSEGFGTKDEQGRFTYVNRTLCDLLGYRKEELIGRSSLEFHDDTNRDIAERQMHMRRMGEESSYELSWRRRDGSTLTTIVSPRRIVDKNGRFLGSFSVYTDITERKRFEQALQASEANYRAIFDAANDAIFIHDLHTHEILDVNVKMTEMFGCTREEARQLSVPALSLNEPPYTESEVVQRMNRAINDGAQLFEWRARSVTGREFWVEVNLKRAFIGGHERLLAIVRDISERKAAEAEQQSLEAQIRHSQKLESLGVLAGGIAHDFNNLLMGVLGNADLAMGELGPSSPARDTIQQIQTAALRAAELTHQLLAYSGKGKFVVQPLNLSILVEEMSHLLRISISKGVILRQDLPHDLPPIMADASQIRQVVMNLITNASDAIGSESGIVSIRTGLLELDEAYLSQTFLDDNLEKGQYVYCEVSDTGCGMDETTRSRIFDPFFTTKFTGRGLGLAAVLGIVRGHKGAIKVYSEPGRGTTFKVLFPAAEQHQYPEDREQQDDADWRGQGVILVVDDEETVRNVTRKMLHSMGFTVLTASDGREGVSVYSANAPEIKAVVLDMTMPHMGGEETYRELRRISPNVQVILCSGYSEQETTSQFAGKGLAGFLQKPFRPAELRDILRNVLEPS